MRRCLSCTCTEKAYLPQRYVVVIMCMLAIIICYGQRICVDLAVTEMTTAGEYNATDECATVSNETIEDHPQFNISGGEIPWSDTIQNYVAGSFFVGYFVGHLPSGILCDRNGARYVFLSGIALSTTVTIITPIIITSTPPLVTIILRVMVGFAQSVVYPCVGVLFARWIPSYERAFMISVSWGANSLGVIFGNILTGAVIQMTANWPSAFYLWAVLGGIWCVLFIFFAYSDPVSHPFIMEKELDMLEVEIVQSERIKPPWKSILMSMPLWGLIVAELGHGFTLYTLMNSLPVYLTVVLHYQAQNKLTIALPFTSQWIAAMLSGKLTDYLIAKKGVSTALMRRIMGTIGITVPCIFVVVGGYMGCNGFAAVLMFTFAMLFKGTIYSGFKPNVLDISTNFVGISMALTNGIGALSGWLSPPIIEAAAPNDTLAEWTFVFWVIFGLGVSSNVFYCIVCSDQRQFWDFPEEESETN